MNLARQDQRFAPGPGDKSGWRPTTGDRRPELLTQIADAISDSLAGKTFDGSLKFICGAPALADNCANTEDRDTDCTIQLSAENLKKLLKGKLTPMTGGLDKAEIRR
ncbi:hypothetical protein GCM10010961_07810 [Pseudodonghicola xiamenensis]|uniref:Uncharacterized protein n=1 Tax=Pseudodonghicola xiamenensis TaxID=337702 RepID=A0A8J3MDF6_9RHOB|nr:hypothetical protein GCM10010961_07810 [Pseudodonghicola xiamenensis]